MGTKQIENLEKELETLLRELQWPRRRFVRMLFEEEWEDFPDPVPGERDKEFERYYDKYKKRLSRGSRDPLAIKREIRYVFEFADQLGRKLDYVFREPLSLGILNKELESKLGSIFSDGEN